MDRSISAHEGLEPSTLTSCPAHIISKYQVPRSVLSKWKKQLLDNGPEIYKKGNQPVQAYNNGNMEKLHATIGRLKVENDFLQQASSKLML